MKDAITKLESHLDRHPSPMDRAFQVSNFVEGTIIKVHTDEANNVIFTADVVTIKNEAKHNVPFLFPGASVNGAAGIFSVPNVGDKCLIALAAGNSAYIVGYHPTVQLSPARGSAATGGEKVYKGAFSKSQLIPGAVEIRSIAGNRILMHPAGSIAIDARTDLFSFYDAISSTYEAMSRNRKIFTAGGSMVWEEGREKARGSMRFFSELYTKAANQENLDKGALRGGARMTILFSEDADHFFLEVTDEDDITSRIQIGPNGIILTSSDGVNQGSIAVSPDGQFSFIAGDPDALHTLLNLAPSAIAIVARNGATPLAQVVANTDGTVEVSAQTKVTLDAPTVTSQGGKTALGALGGLGVVRAIQDKVIVFGVQGGNSSATGFVMQGSGLVTSG